MVKDLTLSNEDESNFSNVFQTNTNAFNSISSIHDSLTNNFKQCKTYETSS